MFVEAAVATSSGDTIEFLLQRRSMTVLAASKRILAICLKQLSDSASSLFPNAPLWYNPNLGEFYKLNEGARCAQYGVKYAHRLYKVGKFKPFSQLQAESGIPCSIFSMCNLNMLHWLSMIPVCVFC